MPGNPRKPSGVSRQHRPILLLILLRETAAKRDTNPDRDVPLFDLAQCTAGWLETPATRVFLGECNPFKVTGQHLVGKGRIHPTTIKTKQALREQILLHACVVAPQSDGHLRRCCL